MAYSYDMVRFERGQVWMVRFKNNEAVGHEQSKDRPWLILSVGKFNKSSGMFTAVPITSRNAVVSPAQVLFNDERNKFSVILCEQIRTFDHSSGAYIFDFMGNLSDEVMEKVDVALSIHLGMHYSPLSLNKLYDSMEAIIKSIGYTEKQNSTPKFTNEDVEKFAEELRSVAENNYDIQQKINRYSNPLDEIREGSTTVTPDESSNVGSITRVKETTPTQRMKWTPEICKEFLDDAENLPMKQVLEKWNISKKTRYYSMKNYAQRILTEMSK